MKTKLRLYSIGLLLFNLIFSIQNSHAQSSSGIVMITCQKWYTNSNFDSPPFHSLKSTKTTVATPCNMLIDFSKASDSKFKVTRSASCTIAPGMAGCQVDLNKIKFDNCSDCNEPLAPVKVTGSTQLTEAELARGCMPSERGTPKVAIVSLRNGNLREAGEYYTLYGARYPTIDWSSYCQLSPLYCPELPKQSVIQLNYYYDCANVTF